MRRAAGVLILLALTSAAACSNAGEHDATTAQDTLTRAQRDSIIGASSLPGARSVQRAIDARDSANARNTALDSTLR
jgi:hypothetical protein